MIEGLVAASLTESVSEALRRQVINGQIQPGLRITEGWVAERFGVARPTAKAGLDRLTAEGILRRGPRRSSTVPLLSADDISDIYYAREPVESLAVRALAAERRVPEAAQRALTEMRTAAKQGLHVDHTEADVAFHKALVEGTTSARLAKMHQTVMGEAQLCIAQVRRRASVDLDELTARHAAIVAEIRAGHEDGAVVALKADLDGCRRTLLDDLANKVAV